MSADGWSEPVSGQVIVEGLRAPTEHRSWFFRTVRGLDRLEMPEDRPGGSEVDWQGVDEAVQESLARLTARVKVAIPMLSWKSKSHHARSIALSSYRIFDRLDGDDFDPIYVGVTFEADGGRVRVSGDISGEETGHIYFDRGCERSVPNDHQSVLLAAIEVAGLLSEQERTVVEAVTTR